MTSLLSVNSLCAGYGAAQVLFGIDFSADQGQVVSLLGRNGMGRSTVIKCLFGLLPVTKGVITFSGQRLDRMPSYRRAQMGLGFVPEGRQVFPNLTVEENLIATARSSQNAKLEPWTLNRIYQFFPRLEERKSNFGSQLSGGEQQMLAIGRALLTNPRLLILDEATEGLAPLIRAEIWAVLTRLKYEGLSMIVVDKNISALLELADQHYVIEKGVVVWSGGSSSLRSDSQLVQSYLGV